MFGFIKKSLQRKLVALFFVCTLMPLLTVAVISSYYNRKALQKAAFDKLTVVETLKKIAITEFFKERLEDIKVLSKGHMIITATEELSRYEHSIKKSSNGSFDISTDEYKAICKKIDPGLNFYINTYHYQELYIICSEHGYIQYSTSRNIDVGTSLLHGPYRNSGFAKLWSRVVKSGKPVIMDYFRYEPYNNEPSIFSGAPVRDASGKIIAVVALKIDTNSLNFIMNERTGLGETGESYIVGSDFLMRSDSRFKKSATESDILSKKVDTRASREALKGHSSTEIIKDYRGIDVLSAYSPLNMHLGPGVDINWTIISETDTSEAFAPIIKWENRLALLSIILLGISITIGFFSARSVASPIKQLSESFALMAAGDLTLKPVDIHRTDEVGVLVESFNNMLETLKKQTKELTDGAAKLLSAVTKVVASTTQFAANSAETSTSVSEITTTIEEVRQTSKVSNDKAEEIASTSDKVAEVAENGEKATNEVILSMNRIKDEVESVADSIIKLSAHTQNIGEIIGAVNDIADQSNLLSVNASIEAAKAGEYGKGFAVVAQEVKNLADQSKEATKQISSILNDIQKATGSAVMATERGGKVVEEGVRLSKESGHSIAILADAAVQSSGSSKQIAASTRQQTIGLDQLVVAMGNIKGATEQNMEGAKQLEEVSQAIQELSIKLKELTDRYKV